MKEPNLEGMIEFLSEIGDAVEKTEKAEMDREDSIVVNVFNSGRDNIKEVEQVIYFSCKERACSTQDEISRMSDVEKKTKVIKALIWLYPLSKNLVIEMIKKADFNPETFLKVYDVNCELLGYIKRNIDFVKSNSISSQHSVNEYTEKLNRLQKEVEKLKKERQSLEESIDGYREKSKEKEELEKAIEELQRIKDSGIDKEIDSLKFEMNRLESEIEDKQKRKDDLENEIDRIKDELHKYESGMPEEYQEALNCLQKCMEELSK